MEHLFSIEALTSLLALTFMEVLLGIDNVIFVSIILGRLPNEKDKKRASLIWMVVGIIFRILLLFFLAKLIDSTGRLFTIFDHEVSLKDIITLGGGLFLIPHGYIYFAMAFSFGVEVLNLRMRKKHGKTIELHEAHFVAEEQNLNDSAN